MAHVHVSQVCWQIYGDARCTCVENLLEARCGLSKSLPDPKRCCLWPLVTFQPKWNYLFLKQQSSLEVSLNACQINRHCKPKFKSRLEALYMCGRKTKNISIICSKLEKIQVNKYVIQLTEIYVCGTVTLCWSSSMNTKTWKRLHIGMTEKTPSDCVWPRMAAGSVRFQLWKLAHPPRQPSKGSVSTEDQEK